MRSSNKQDGELDAAVTDVELEAMLLAAAVVTGVE